MENVTLMLNDDLFQQAERRAAECHCSLSEWVEKLIIAEVSRAADFAAARERAVKNLDNAFHLGGEPLSREETHER